MVDDLKLIKKHFGEEFAHFCRSSFPTILEMPGSLSNIILSHFNPTKFLYKDLVKQNKQEDFISYINGLFDSGIKEVVEQIKTPTELLNEAGYILYECKTEEDINQFKKYYTLDEEICTFWTHRLDQCYVFFAVKKGIENIKRADFKEPKRQDAYGTSVISIQFTRDKSHLLSIKNRYNHTVPNCDATFSNNLDNIINGLTDSFATHYGMIQSFQNTFEINGYTLANDGKYYKYNYEINNIYYCPDNIIIDNGKPHCFEKETYLVFDYFILGIKNKKIRAYDASSRFNSFPESIGDIEKISIIKEENNKRITITPLKGEDITIIIDERNRIIQYINHNVSVIKSDFLALCKTIIILEIPNAIIIGDYFCREANILKLVLPNAERVGCSFLEYGRKTKQLIMPRLKSAGDNFCRYNEEMKEFIFPELEKVGNSFVERNDKAKRIYMPKLKVAGSFFFTSNSSLIEASFPSLEKAGGYFLDQAQKLKRIYMPRIKIIGQPFLNNRLPHLQQIEISEASATVKNNLKQRGLTRVRRKSKK